MKRKQYKTWSTEELRNADNTQMVKLLKQYDALINKITRQYSTKIPKMSYTDIRSMANEGFALAIQKYDDEKSSMNFTQYVAFSMKNNILSSLDNELRTVKLSGYAQKKTIDEGKSTFNTLSIDACMDRDSDYTSKEILSIQSPQEIRYNNIYKHLYEKIDNNFSKRDRTIFYRTFGLKSYKQQSKGIKIAKDYNISSGLVSQIVKRIITFIKDDDILREDIAQLL